MKKYPVLKRFKDKNTGKCYIVGDSYPTDDCDRSSDLQRLGYIGGDSVQEAPAAEKKLKDMNLEQLGKVVADEVVDIGDAKTKAQIVAKIEEARKAAEDTSTAPAAAVPSVDSGASACASAPEDPSKAAE